MTKQQLVNQIARPAICMKVGGFRPTDNPLASWIGKVLVAGANEGWPVANGNPMLPLCQINLDAFPFKPEPVSDLALIAVFIDAEKLPRDEDVNGTSWCLRAYPTTDGLVALEQRKTASPIKPMPMMPEGIEQDFPHWEDCPVPVPAAFAETYDDHFPNASGIKVSGWPTLIQGEVSWTSAVEPQFAFQIDSVEKARWQWGDNGIAYFGRNRKKAELNQWTFAWQSY